VTTAQEPIDIRITVENGTISRIVSLEETLTLGRQRERSDCPTCSSRMTSENTPQPGRTFGRTLRCPTCAGLHIEIKPAGIPQLLDHDPQQARRRPKMDAQHVPERLLVVRRASIADSPFDSVVLQCRASASREGFDHEPWRVVIVDEQGRVTGSVRRDVGILHDGAGEAVLAYRPDAYTSQSQTFLSLLVIRQPRGGTTRGGGSTIPSPRWGDQTNHKRALAKLSSEIFPNGELPSPNVAAKPGRSGARGWAMAIAFFALEQADGATPRLTAIGLQSSNYRRPLSLWDYLQLGLEDAKRGLHFDAPFGLETLLGHEKSALTDNRISACVAMVKTLRERGFIVPQRAMDQIIEALGDSHA